MAQIKFELKGNWNWAKNQNIFVQNKQKFYCQEPSK